MFEVGERNEETLLFLSDVNDEVAFARVSRLSREDPHLFLFLGESDSISGICWCCSSGLLASIYRVCFRGGTGIPISLSLCSLFVRHLGSCTGKHRKAGRFSSSCKNAALSLQQTWREERNDAAIESERRCQNWSRHVLCVCVSNERNRSLLRGVFSCRFSCVTFWRYREGLFMKDKIEALFP